MLPSQRHPRLALALTACLLLFGACGRSTDGVPTLHWYVFDEPSGAFAEAARRCTEGAGGAYEVVLRPLPTDASQQREQLVRRLAAGDEAIDIMGMDVIWTPEFAAAGWLLPWPESRADAVSRGRLAAPLESATYHGRLWGVPFTTNTQLLWYRRDRVPKPPATWEEMLAMAENLGTPGAIQVQGERYEGFTVFFTALVASAGGSVLTADGGAVSLEREPTLRALDVMGRLAASPAAPTGLANAREDHGRRAFEAGIATFMVNYTYVWASARAHAPAVAADMGWARWPAVVPGRPSRVTLGGVNLGVGAHTRHPGLAFEAAACIAAADHQRLAAARGGLPPTIAALYDDPGVRAVFPFADLLRATLEDAVQRPRTPLYNDVSLAISRTLHPMAAIEPERDLARLRAALGRALRSEGLL